MSVIDDLKRLERIGSEHSLNTVKLKTSAHEVARIIFAMIDDGALVPAIYVDDDEEDPKPSAVEGLKLPRGYTVATITRGISGRPVFLPPVDSQDSWVSDLMFSQPTRKAALHFAADVATGLINEIAEWLEEKNIEVKSLSRHLDSALQ